MKKLSIFFLFLIGMFCCCGIAAAQTAGQTPAATATIAVPQSREQVTLSFASLVKQVTPAVVNIYTQRVVRQHVSPLFDDPFFRQFFGHGMPQGVLRQRMENALGSGVIVRADGLIVTARHVIADADQIRVVLSDRREFDAKLVISDEHADLALLQIENKGAALPFLDLRDSDEAQVGDLVLAIGNPFGVGQTVTMGIISALTHKAVGDGDFGYFIQTDAAINPGNSGGALVTMDGKLVGINASIYSRDGGNMGIGFAVPTNLVRALMRATAMGKTSIVHPWTGIEGQEVTQDIATSLGLAGPSGFLVKSLNAASPAAKAGLRVGDVVVSVDGHAVEDLPSFRYRIGTMPIGARATLGVLRQGKRQDIAVDMIAPPENTPRDASFVTGQNPLSGAKIANLSPAVAAEMGGDDAAQGVIITAIKSGTPAAQMGVQVGDIIVGINGSQMTQVGDVLAALRKPTRSWRIILQRGGNQITLMFNG